MSDAEKKYKHIFEPGQINKLKVKNRIKMASTTTLYCSEEGLVTDREVAFLAARARGGAGIVTTAGMVIHPTGTPFPGIETLYGDEAMSGLSRTAKVIKDNGAAAIAQLLHYGREANPSEEWGPPLGPSGVPPRVPRFKQERAMTKDEIKEMVDAFAERALRVKKAGFDGVELSPLIAFNFLWPWCNLRTDEYGGSLENRARFITEIIRAVRQKVGNDYPVITRLRATELEPDGTPEEDIRKVAKMCEEAGIDAISLMVGSHESSQPSLTMEIPPGHWLYLAEGMKRVLKIPVMMSFRLNHPDIAEKALEAGVIDFWEMSRPLIADPELPNKTREGRVDEIVLCMACNQGCFSRLFNAQPMSCLINPMVGREEDEKYQIKPAQVRKKVFVIGGGPGGMEAAIILAQRGHEVTLFEKEPVLGGQVELAAKTPTRGEMSSITKSLSTQLRKSGCKIELNREVTAVFLREAKPDVVVVATGARPIIPDIPIREGSHVVTSHQVLRGEVKVGSKVLVWGGRQIGAQVAEFLAAQGKKITIIEESRTFAKDASLWDAHHFRARLYRTGAKCLTYTTLKEIRPGEVVVVSKEGEQVIAVDTVVAAKELKPNKELFEELKGDFSELYPVGDCVAPRKAINAIHDGFSVGLQV